MHEKMVLMIKLKVTVIVNLDLVIGRNLNQEAERKTKPILM